MKKLLLFIILIFTNLLIWSQASFLVCPNDTAVNLSDGITFYADEAIQYYGDDAFVLVGSTVNNLGTSFTVPENTNLSSFLLFYCLFAEIKGDTFVIDECVRAVVNSCLTMQCPEEVWIDPVDVISIEDIVEWVDIQAPGGCAAIAGIGDNLDLNVWVSPEDIDSGYKIIDFYIYNGEFLYTSCQIKVNFITCKNYCPADTIEFINYSDHPILISDLIDYWPCQDGDYVMFADVSYFPLQFVSEMDVTEDMEVIICEFNPATGMNPLPGLECAIYLDIPDCPPVTCTPELDVFVHPDGTIEVSVIVTNECGNYILIDTLIEPTNIQLIKGATIKRNPASIYPNPTSSELTIYKGYLSTGIELYSANRLVQSWEPSNQVSINRSLPSGVYTLVVAFEDRIEQYQITKQ